jgi:hypothetical protein
MNNRNFIFSPSQPAILIYVFVCMSGNNYCLNNSAVDVFLQYEPQPTSTKTMIHLAQSTTLFVPK